MAPPANASACTPDHLIGPAAVAEARAVMRRHGHGALLPFQAAPGMSLFLATSGRAVIAHARAGRLSIVLGDPVGPPSEGGAAILEFIEYARGTGKDEGCKCGDNQDNDGQFYQGEGARGKH